jgi:hypothetical protein
MILKKRYILLLAKFVLTAQHAPDKQTKSILIMNATPLRNGQVIQNSAIGFKDGKLTLVADTKIRLAQGTYDTTIDDWQTRLSRFYCSKFNLRISRNRCCKIISEDDEKRTKTPTTVQIPLSR